MKPKAADPHPTSWPGTLASAGEVGARIAAHDWAHTSLGPIETWPAALRLAASLVCESRGPAVLFWGEARIAIANGACEALLEGAAAASGASPSVLGREGGILEPAVTRAFHGEASLSEGETGWSVVPIRDEDGRVAGALATAVVLPPGGATDTGPEPPASPVGGPPSLAILESISDGLISVERDWTVAYLNARAEEIVRPLHDPAGDIVGRSFWDVFPMLRGTGMGGRFEHAMEAGQMTAFETHYPPLDGWFDVRAYPSRFGLSIYFLDITERKRAEQALRRSERLLQAVVDQMPSGVYVAEAPSGRILYHNDAAERLLGHPRIEVGDVHGYAAYAAYHPNGTPFAAEEHPLARALTGEVVAQQEVTYRCADGRTVTLAASAAPVRDADGTTVLAVTAFHDITDLKRFQEELRQLNETLEQQVDARAAELREQEERFRSLVQASAASVWTADATGRLVEDSVSWREYTGQSSEDSRGAGWLDAVHPDDRERVREDWERCVADGVAQDIELRVWHAPTQRYHWVAGRSVPLRGPDGEVRGWIGMDVDIDERKRAEGRVRDLASRLTAVEQEERRRIAQILHDDLQQMLHGIDMKLTMAIQRLNPAQLPAVRKELDEARWWIAQGVSTARNLTADVSPPILGQESLADALGWLRHHMHDLHGLHIDMDAEHPFRMPEAEVRILLFNVVRELLFNVKKHAGVDHAVLELEEVDGQLVVNVMDEGRGFDVASVLAAEESGRGFGLFSIQERLGLLGGRLEIDSAPGEGTHVRVIAPWTAEGLQREA